MKHYAVEVDHKGRRTITSARYPCRAEALQACNRHAPRFHPRVVAVQPEPAIAAFCRAFDDTVTGALA